MIALALSESSALGILICPWIVTGNYKRYYHTDLNHALDIKQWPALCAIICLIFSPPSWGWTVVARLCMSHVLEIHGTLVFIVVQDVGLCDYDTWEVYIPEITQSASLHFDVSTFSVVVDFGWDWVIRTSYYWFMKSSSCYVNK